MRVFESGATRDTDQGKLDYEGFLSPLVLKRYAQYLDKHRVQSDGSLRGSSNWQLGMTLDVYMKSLLRHVQDVWLIYDEFPEEAVNADIEEALSAVMFNSMGMLFEILKKKKKELNSGQ